jgi:spermidine synthase
VAHPRAQSAFLIGQGIGVTTHVLASVPGMQRVKMVEIEPAVLAMDSFFRAVNDSVLLRPNVDAVVDDARSALQLDRTRYDVIVSEPSNPWVAGIATLYTPEFFRIAKSRLADDGIFCQWIQLYQLPLPIVAGIVRSLREVFPHVHIWFGGTSDLVVLASERPISYDREWMAQLLGPGGQLHSLGREWLSIDSPDQYFGRMLLGDSGVARLITRATFDHTDNRPRLEFVAARRFLDPTLSCRWGGGTRERRRSHCCESSRCGAAIPACCPTWKARTARNPTLRSGVCGWPAFASQWATPRAPTRCSRRRSRAVPAPTRSRRGRCSRRFETSRSRRCI